MEREKLTTEERALIEAVDSLNNIEHFKVLKKHLTATRESLIGSLIEPSVISNTNLHNVVTGKINAYDELMWMLDNKKLVDSLSIITK